MSPPTTTNALTSSSSSFLTPDNDNNDNNSKYIITNNTTTTATTSTNTNSSISHFLEQHQPDKFDIIRGDSKDKYYRSRQLNLFRSAFASIPQINSDQCRLLSDCLYYSLTTLLSRQTLGEECYYLVELGPRNAIPNLIQRVVMIALKIYVPYVTRRVSNLKLLRSILVFFHKLNQLVFMWSRKIAYFNLENRFSRISYLSLSGNSSQNSPTTTTSSGLRLIAALKTINLAMLGASLIKEWRKGIRGRRSAKTSPSVPSPPSVNESCRPSEPPIRIDPTIKCSICLEMIKNPTLTSCGHLFCWQCVQSYALNVNNSAGTFNCPSCRLLVKSDKLIFLHNF